MRPTAKSTDSTKKECKVFTKNGKEIFAYTVYGESLQEK